MISLGIKVSKFKNYIFTSRNNEWVRCEVMITHGATSATRSKMCKIETFIKHVYNSRYKRLEKCIVL